MPAGKRKRGAETAGAPRPASVRAFLTSNGGRTRGGHRARRTRPPRSRASPRRLGRIRRGAPPPTRPRCGTGRTETGWPATSPGTRTGRHPRRPRRAHRTTVSGGPLRALGAPGATRATDWLLSVRTVLARLPTRSHCAHTRVDQDGRTRTWRSLMTDTNPSESGDGERGGHPSARGPVRAPVLRTMTALAVCVGLVATGCAAGNRHRHRGCEYRRGGRGANSFLGTLSEGQRETVLHGFDDEAETTWSNLQVGDVRAAGGRQGLLGRTMVLDALRHMRGSSGKSGRRPNRCSTG